MKLPQKVARKSAELVFNGVVAKLPNRGFRKLRVAYLRLLGASVGSNVRISRQHKILGAQNLTIEDDVAIANSVLLDARGGLTIQRGALIGFQSIILTYTHAWPDPALPVQVQGAVARPIVIGALSWLGMRVMLLPGAAVGKSTVVGAGSVLSKRLPELVVAAGSPCTVISERRDRSDLSE